MSDAAADLPNADVTLTSPGLPTPPAPSSPTPAQFDSTLPRTGPATSDPAGGLGDYELLAEVARGGMGIVYKARDRRLNRVVALKVTRAGRFESDHEARRLVAEAEAAAKLDHPHIVPIYEVGEAGGQHFFSMAFVEGESLAEATRAGPLPPRRAAGVMKHVADAVAYAHAHGVIHRDLKPSNILLDPGGQPRVTDFGLAKRADLDSTLTQAGQVMGTPSFMPPEQAEGKNDQVGPPADVYALGATLYHLVTGRPPFQAASVPETLKQVVEREPVAPRTLNHSVDRDLNTIVLKCLQKRPEKRYESAAALADDLQRYLDRRPILARPVGDVQKLVRWGRRNPLVAASLAGITAIFVTAFALVSWSYVRAEDARKEEANQRQAAQDREKAERWERYRANMIAAGSAMQLHNVMAARSALEAAPEEHRNWEWKYFSHQLDTAQHVVRVGDQSPAIGVSSDGTLAAAQSAAGPVGVWDIGTRKQIGAPQTRATGDLFRFSPDNQLLAYESAEGIALWDVGGGRPRAVLGGPGDTLADQPFGPDGTRLAAFSSRDRAVRVWDTTTGKELLVLHGHEDPIGRTAFSSDGRRIVSAGGPDRTARIWDAATGQPLRVLRGHAGEVARAIFNPQGDRVLTVEAWPSNLLRLWDATTGEPVAEMPGHTNAAPEVAFSPDGTRIASGGVDQTVRLWDGRTGRPLSSREGHRGRIREVAFSPDGKYLVTAADDRTARLWDAATGDPVCVLHGHTGMIPAVRYTPDGRTIVTPSFDGTVRLWDARTAERNGALRGHTSFVYDVAFHPDGDRVASAAWDGTVRVWDATTGDPLRRLDFPAGRLTEKTTLSGVAFHPAGNLLASAGRFDDVRLWDPATGRGVHHFDSPNDRYGRLKFSPGGDRLASGVGDTVRVWDVDRRAEVARLRGHEAIDVAFGPDGAWLASAGIDRTVRVWDAGKWEQIRILEGHTDQVNGLAVSRDGRWLASASHDGTARVWDTTTWKEATAPLPHGTNVYGVAFSPDGTRLACACANSLIRLWDLTTFQLVAELDGHQAYVHQVAFSPDGTRLVSGSGDHTVRVWDSLSAQERAGK